MTLTKENLLKNIKNSHSTACVKEPTKNKPRDGAADQGDEMDTRRTQRRFNSYTDSVQDFLDYFGRDDRMVKVDTSAAQVQHIWDAVRDFFAAEMDFEANRCLNTVVLFTFGKCAAFESRLEPFTPKSDQFPIFSAASTEILHHTKRRTWLFIVYFDDDYVPNSHYITLYISLKRLGECTFWTWKWKGSTVQQCAQYCI